MLGVRLDSETERGLQAYARRTGQPKSVIVREAIRDFVARKDILAQARADWERISRLEADDPEIMGMLDWALSQLDDLK